MKRKMERMGWIADMVGFAMLLTGLSAEAAAGPDQAVINDEIVERGWHRQVH